MQDLRKGYIFIREACKLALKNAALLKTGTWLFLDGLILTACFLIPVFLIVMLVDPGLWQMAAVGVTCGVFLFLSFAISEPGSLGSDHAFNALDAGGSISLPDARSAKRSGWKHAFQIGLANPLLSMTRWVPNMPGRQKQPWLKGYFLLSPLIAVEGLNLPQAVLRLKDLANRNLLRFKPSSAKVGLILTATAWLVILLGAFLGAWLGLSLAAGSLVENAGRALAAVAGFLLAALFNMAAIGLRAFFTGIYHTAVYRWTRALEDAGQDGTLSSADMPEILSVAVGVS